MTTKIQIADFSIGDGNLVMIAGPCVIESEAATLEIARALREIARELALPLIFKASYDKANRTSLSSYRGPGLEKGLEILARVKAEVGLPVLSDVHEVAQVAPAAEVLDVLQIPAFLCRQTDLVVAAAQTGKVVNIKKGQFLAPWDMQPVVEKVRAAGNDQIILTERGVILRLQQPGGGFPQSPHHAGSGLPGGPGRHPQRPASRRPGELLRGPAGVYRLTWPGPAVAVGVDGLFMEVHADPDQALCDGPNSLPLKEVPALWRELKALHAVLSGPGEIKVAAGFSRRGFYFGGAGRVGRASPPANRP